MVAMENMTLQTLTNSYNQWIVHLIMGTLISGWVFKQKERIEMQMKKTEITPITWNKNQINPLLPRSSFLLQDVSKNGCSDYLWAAQKTNCLLREVNGRQIRKGRIVQRYWFQVASLKGGRMINSKYDPMVVWPPPPFHLYCRNFTILSNLKLSSEQPC